MKKRNAVIFLVIAAMLLLCIAGYQRAEANKCIYISKHNGDSAIDVYNCSNGHNLQVDVIFETMSYEEDKIIDLRDSCTLSPGESKVLKGNNIFYKPIRLKKYKVKFLDVKKYDIRGMTKIIFAGVLLAVLSVIIREKSYVKAGVFSIIAIFTIALLIVLFKILSSAIWNCPVEIYYDGLLLF